MADCNKVFQVTEAHLIAEAGRLYVRAWGIASTNASNPRLEQQPSIPTLLSLNFCCDPGPLPVLTKVEAIYQVASVEGIDAIEVHGDTNTVTIRVKG